MSATLGHTLGSTETSRSNKGTRLTPFLIVAFECQRPLVRSTRHCLADTDVVSLGRGQERGVASTGDGERMLSIQVPDRRMSASHATITRAVDRWVVEDSGSRNGTRVNGKAVSRHVLADGDLLELGHTFFLYQEFEVGVEVGVPDPAAVGSPVGMSTLSHHLAQEFDKLVQLAESEVPILILGASGTGKEILARAIHRLSGRTGDFVGVNCGAIPDSLVESELFGHKKGAFSGAVADRLGLIRNAQDGTLFLDEIGDLALSSQAKLLRVLQERELRPVGASRTVPVDVRLVYATHQDLSAKIEAGDFRDDLFARIAGFTIRLPALNQRREDLGLLIAELLRRLAPEHADLVAFHIDAARALFSYGWPRNIRELENCLATAVVLAGENPIGLEHLPEALHETTAPHAEEPATPPASLDSTQRQHREELVALLRQHDGNISAVARALGKDRKQIQRWVKRYAIDLDRLRHSP